MYCMTLVFLTLFLICHWAINFEQFLCNSGVFCEFMVLVEADGQNRCWFPSLLTCRDSPIPLKITTKQYHRCLSKGHLFLCCLKLFSCQKGKLYSVMSSPSQCLFTFWAGILFWTNQKVTYLHETENIFCINGKLKSCIFCVCKYDVLYHSSISHLFVIPHP